MGTINSGLFPITVTSGNYGGIATACTISNNNNLARVAITHTDPGFSYHVHAI